MNSSIWNFDEWIAELFYNLSGFLLNIVNMFQKAFMVLAGADATTSNQLGGVNLLDGIWSDPIVRAMFIFFLSVAGIMMVVTIVLAIIKGATQKDIPGSNAKVIRSILISFATIVLIPIIAIIGMWTVTALLSGVVNEFGYQITGSAGNEHANTIANAIWKSSFNSNAQRMIDTRDPILTFKNSYADVSEVVNLTFSGDYNYVLAILVGAIVLYSLIMATVGLVERIISLLMLYFLAPTMAATMPMDDGKRFGLWRDQFVSKLFSVVGNIMTMYIYLLLISLTNELLMNPPSGFEEVFSIVKIAIIIGGAFAVNKGGQIIAGLVSTGQGLQDGLSAMQSNALMRGGMMLGGAALSVAGKLASGRAMTQTGRMGQQMAKSSKGGGTQQANSGGGSGGASMGAFDGNGSSPINPAMNVGNAAAAGAAAGVGGSVANKLLNGNQGGGDKAPSKTPDSSKGNISDATAGKKESAAKGNKNSGNELNEVSGPINKAGNSGTQVENQAGTPKKELKPLPDKKEGVVSKARNAFDIPFAIGRTGQNIAAKAKEKMSAVPTSKLGKAASAVNKATKPLQYAVKKTGQLAWGTAKFAGRTLKNLWQKGLIGGTAASIGDGVRTLGRGGKSFGTDLRGARDKSDAKALQRNTTKQTANEILNSKGNAFEKLGNISNADNRKRVTNEVMSRGNRNPETKKRLSSDMKDHFQQNHSAMAKRSNQLINKDFGNDFFKKLEDKKQGNNKQDVSNVLNRR